MTGIRARTDDGTLVPDVTPLEVRRLLAETATLRLERTGRPGDTATARRDGEAWLVTTSSADAGRETRAPNTDAGYDLLRSWAADDGWWLEAFLWTPADSPGHG